MFYKFFEQHNKHITFFYICILFAFSGYFLLVLESRIDI